MPRKSRHAPERYAELRVRLAGEIGARIRHRRADLRLDQDDLRGRMELGDAYVSRAQLSRFETGQSLPDVAEALALAAALGIEVGWLLTGEDAKD